jgi:prepilin-type N-terminal cleavage/methylation domain-containing protein
MSASVTPRLARVREDAGTTLVELLVVMVVFAVLAGATVALFIGSLRTATGTQARLEEIQDGRIAVSAMGKALRTAILPKQLPGGSIAETAAFIEAKPNSIRFFANINNVDNTVGASKVAFAVDANGVLTQTVQPPDAPNPANPGVHYCTPGPGCAVKTIVLARGVVTGATPLFVYYDQLGNKLTGSTLTDDQLEVVDSVDIQVTTKQQRASGDGSTYELRVAMPNHDAVVRNGEN